jgi:hypothetical protein
LHAFAEDKAFGDVGLVADPDGGAAMGLAYKVDVCINVTAAAEFEVADAIDQGWAFGDGVTDDVGFWNGPAGAGGRAWLADAGEDVVAQLKDFEGHRQVMGSGFRFLSGVGGFGCGHPD